MKYSTTLGEKICERTATSSIGLRHICKELGLPYSTVTNWIYDESHELYEKYKRAKIMQIHHLAEEILEIADDSTNDYMTVVMKSGKTKQVLNREAIARSRLRIQARTTLIAKLSPILRESKIKPAKKKPTRNYQKEPLTNAEIKERMALNRQYEKFNDSPAEQDEMPKSKNAHSKHHRAHAKQKKNPVSSPKSPPNPRL